MYIKLIKELAMPTNALTRGIKLKIESEYLKREK